MIRALLVQAGLFLVPFAIYAFVVWVSRREVPSPLTWPPRTLGLLALSGFVLMTVSLILLAQFSGARPGSTYVPAHVEDGRLVPGGVK